jgi:hypothetical protein
MNKHRDYSRSVLVVALWRAMEGWNAGENDSEGMHVPPAAFILQWYADLAYVLVERVVRPTDE